MKSKLIVSLLLFIIFIVFLSCGKKEEKLQAFNAETFAYSIDNYWEVNASFRVKGVQQNKLKDSDEYLAALSYAVDIIHPDGKIEKAKYSFAHSGKNSEIVSDIGLNAQFELDSTYKQGVYKLVFTITDAHSNQTTSIEKELNLTK